MVSDDNHEHEHELAAELAAERKRSATLCTELAVARDARLEAVIGGVSSLIETVREDVRGLAHEFKTEHGELEKRQVATERVVGEAQRREAGRAWVDRAVTGVIVTGLNWAALALLGLLRVG